METEGREVQSLAHGGSEGQRLCSASQGPGPRGPGLRAEGTLPEDSSLAALLAVTIEPCWPSTTTSDRSCQRAAIRRAGAKIPPPPETAPSRSPQPQTPTWPASPPRPRPRPAAHPRMRTVQTRGRRRLASPSPSGSPRWVLKTASFCLRITGPSLSASFLLTP